MSIARYWKQLLSQHRQLPLQHNHALQLVRTVILHNHHNAATTSTSQHPKSNASVAMALTIYTFALKAGHRQQDCIGTTFRQGNLKHHTLLHICNHVDQLDPSTTQLRTITRISPLKKLLLPQRRRCKKIKSSPPLFLNKESETYPCKQH